MTVTSIHLQNSLLSPDRHCVPVTHGLSCPNPWLPHPLRVSVNLVMPGPSKDWSHATVVLSRWADPHTVSSRLIHAVVCPPFFRLSLPGHHTTFCLPVVRLSVCLSVGTWVAPLWLPSLALSARRALHSVPSGSPWCGWLLWHPCLAVGLCAHAPYSPPSHGHICSRPCLHFSSFGSSPLDGSLDWNYRVSPSDPTLCTGAVKSLLGGGPAGPHLPAVCPSSPVPSGVLNPCNRETAGRRVLLLL